MAKITELEEPVPGKSSFLEFIWMLVRYIICTSAHVLRIFREFLTVKQADDSENAQPEKLILARPQRNWIDTYCQDSSSGHNVVKSTSYSRVTCIGNVLKSLGQQFKEIYTAFYESPETPSATAYSHDAAMNVFQSPNRASFTPDSDYAVIMEKLTRLQDNAEFDAFDKYSSAILDFYGKECPDITTAVLIEQSRCMLYRNRLARTKFLARLSLEIATTTSCPGMFIARACLVLSAQYRAKGKLGKAKAFLDKAWQNLVIATSYEDWCRYYDAYGSYLNGISDTITRPGDIVLENAKGSFFKQLQAAEFCETLKVRQKQQFWALLKMARTLLDANTIFGQQREVAANEVTKAGEYLDKIEAEFWVDVAHGTHVQFLLIRVKQFYRQQRFTEAVGMLKKCITMATVEGYEVDRQLMVDGLKLLSVKAKLQESKTVVKKDVECESNSESRLESLDSSSDSPQLFDSLDDSS